MMNKELKLAYLAGALDGDGSFSLIKGTSHSSVSPLYYPMIQLANANKDLVDVFHSEFGGSISFRASYQGKDGSMRLPSYGWKLEKSTKCLPTLEDMIPYLIVKKQRACFLRDYIIDNPFVRGSNKLSEDLLIKRERAYIKMRSFNDNPETNCTLFSKQKRKDSEDVLFWAYIAGLMDTDGSFSLKRETQRSDSKSDVYTPSILLSMVDCRAIYYIKNNFDGACLMIVKAKTATNGICYRVGISSRTAAISFLENVIPYLITKKQAAQELLRFCKSSMKRYGCKGVPEDQILFRENIYNTIKALNNGVSKSSLMDLKPLPGDAEGNKAQAATACSVNVASGKTSDNSEDAVL